MFGRRASRREAPAGEPPGRTQRLRRALAIGLSHAKRNPPNSTWHITHKASACTAAPTVALGVITAPFNHERRYFVRRSQVVLLPARARFTVGLSFIVGDRRKLSTYELRAVEDENQVGVNRRAA